MEVEKKTSWTFKAGMFNYNTETKAVTPNPAQGIVRLENRQGQKHLIWINLSTNTEELDLITMQSDAHFQVLKRRNALVLWFDSFTDRYFFWLQDATLNIDSVAEKVQKFIDEEEEEPEKEEIRVTPEKKVSTIDEQTKPVQQTSKPNIQASIQNASNQDLIQKLVKRFAQHKVEPMHLGSIINKEFIKYCEQNINESYLKHLPDEQQTKQDFKDTLHSPQLQQAVEALNDALNTENAIGLFHEMHLDPSFLQKYYGVEAFLKALQKWGQDQK